MKPSPRGPRRLLLGHGAVVERKLARVGRAPAELLHRCRDAVPRRPVLDHDVRDLVLVGARGERDAPGDVGARVRDVELRSVHDPRAVAELCRRTRRARIRAGVRLRQAEGGEPPARREIRKPALLLLLRSVVEDRHRPERRVRRDRNCHGRVDPRELLDRDRVRDGVAARTAVALRDRQAHQPELAELRDELVREPAAQIELPRDRLDALPRERPDRVANQLLLGSQVEVHAARILDARDSLPPFANQEETARPWQLHRSSSRLCRVGSARIGSRA